MKEEQQVQSGEIKSGDLFILNGETYECEGADGGYIWYDNGEMELAKAEIQDCVKTWYCMDEIPTKKRCDQQCDYCRRGNTKFLCPICGKTELEEAFGTTDLYCPYCKPEGYTDPNYRFTNLWKNPKLCSSLDRSGSQPGGITQAEDTQMAAGSCLHDLAKHFPGIEEDGAFIELKEMAYRNFDRPSQPGEVLNSQIQERDNRIKELWTDEQVCAFLIDTSNFYFKTAEGNTFFNGCDLLGEEPWTAQQLLEEYKKQLTK